MEKYVVVLNAPANAGKDMVAEYLTSLGCIGEYEVHHKEFKKPLFDIAKAVAQIKDHEWDKLYTREFKEVPSSKLFGRSPREHMIHTSENLIKPVYGNLYFGNVLAMSLDYGINVVSDSGFYSELVPIVDKVKASNILLVRIHRDGCSFDGDSREYLYDTGCKEVDVYNDKSPEDLFYTIENIIDEFIGV